MKDNRISNRRYNRFTVKEISEIEIIYIISDALLEYSYFANCEKIVSDSLYIILCNHHCFLYYSRFLLRTFFVPVPAS